jgi:hypothetical protein
MVNKDNSKTDDDIDAWLSSIQTEEVAPVKSSEPTIPTKEHVFHPYSFKKEESPIKEYLQKIKQAKPLSNFSLLTLQGLERSKKEEVSEKTQEMLAFSLLPEHYQKITGGFYFRAHNKGFVVNPGQNFLEKLHESGLNINSIDFVIVTSNASESFAEAKAIYDLNYKCNLHSDSLHIINYYLNQGAYKNLFATLKPHFKQEKDTVRCLELYMDSPETESVSLTSEVSLNYFLMGKAKENLGISFTIKGHELQKDFSIAWIMLDALDTKELASLGNYDILIGGFNDALENPQQLNHIKELFDKNPQKNSLLLFSENAKKENDTRLQIAKSLKDSLNSKSRLTKTVLPLESGLMIHFHNQTLQCSSCFEYANASDIHVAKSKKSFGKLFYLCSECCL